MSDEKVITNPANTVFPINELIKKRWSARAFSTKSVEKVKLLSNWRHQGGHLHQIMNNHGDTLCLQMNIQRN